MKYLTSNIDAFLVSLILNVNVLRFFLGIDDTNLFLYMIYFFSIIVLYKKNKRRIIRRYEYDNIYKINVWFWSLFLIYSILTCVLFTHQFGVFFKYLVAIIIGLQCIGEGVEKKKLIFQSFLLLNIVYGLIILASPEIAYAYLGKNVNYLNMTLTLGLCLTICLVQSVYVYFFSTKINLVRPILLSLLFFLVIMLFPARGVLLFPPIIAMIAAMVMLKKNMKNRGGKILIFLFGLMVIGMLAFQYFQNNASEFALQHMTRLFEDTEDESRIGIWNNAMMEATNRLWIFFGAGFNGYNNTLGSYPHNILLHMLIDFGVLGFLGFVIIIYKVIRRFLKVDNKQFLNDVYWVNLMCFISFLYYFITFCKSFSMYDSCPLLIMIFLCLSNKRVIKNEIKI